VSIRFSWYFLPFDPAVVFFGMREGLAYRFRNREEAFFSEGFSGLVQKKFPRGMFLAVQSLGKVLSR